MYIPERSYFFDESGANCRAVSAIERVEFDFVITVVSFSSRIRAMCRVGRKTLTQSIVA